MTPPYITVASPKDGDTVRSDKIALSGLINDIVRGTVAEGQAQVTVNGIPARIANRSYLAEAIALNEGDNTIKIDAADNVGNTASLSIHVNYKPLTPQHIDVFSGQGQSAKINATLLEPLKVKLLDGDNQPVVGKPVIFRVTEGDGLVGVGSPDPGQGTLVQTDAQGIAATVFQLGSRAGTGNQRVRAAAVGFDGVALFHASASVGTGDKVTVNSGNNQRGAINQTLPQPLVVAVIDPGANVVAGAAIEFKISQGGGHFQNGQTTFTSTTDSDGRATAEFTLGPEEGLDVHRATATLAGTALYAGFTASALKQGDPGQTQISGVVLDNQDQPLANVTLRIDGTTREAQTDAQGQFHLTEAPVGSIRLIADGSTRNDGNEWSTLAFNLVTVAGADNPLPAPVYLVKLDTQNAKTVGDQDVTLTLPDVPGFALEVKKGSVTFPDGSKTGRLSVTPVNASKIPMPPPNGMQPQFIVTIQPIGAKFDPPAPITLPNVDAHKPGAQVEMFSYDHDLEEFVAIGLGTVSTDGSVIKSNQGVGVIKAGWHCGSQPGGSGCTGGDPGECKALDNSCQTVNLPDGHSAGTCKYCKDGKVVDVSSATDPVSVDMLTIKPVLQDKTPFHWGETLFDPLDKDSIDMTAYCDGTNWKAKVTKAYPQGHENWGLLTKPNQVVEPTSELINSTTNCSALNTMQSNLWDIAHLGQNDADYFYYITEAVRKHEDEHVRQYEVEMKDPFIAFKAKIEAMSIPLKEAENAEDAKKMLMAKGEYPDAIRSLDTASGFIQAVSNLHNPDTPFVEAELSIVRLPLVEVSLRKTTLGCQ
ncbi:carboxypeptidase regulatory-like domain-containing protein [Methylovulum sp.]|uniref:carboxypeptidase regulatory-like domain-containing protein n=1 Tax=Methylovulum sp. TaxID=1916980 RepID=UPI002611F1C3|nr:carboxypeptidase regulatory-like domain-containing protein [Methylovulum sp.]MDD5125537.1 carboxypeptidase regulatory-like domain-containing protein [Methylovulum sp.]